MHMPIDYTRPKYSDQDINRVVNDLAKSYRTAMKAEDCENELCEVNLEFMRQVIYRSLGHKFYKGGLE